MSKKRPSARAVAIPTLVTHSALPKFNPEHWQRRIFRNCFTRDGRRIEVRGWCVKIQHEGRRKTFRLASANREDAALEASRLYRLLVSQGWESVTESRMCAELLGTSLREQASKFETAYWRPRVVLRKYIDLLRPGAGRELCVHVEHEGTRFYFPLETADPEQAAIKSLEIYRTVVREGWDRVSHLFAREITLGIFWSHNPIACTYSTIFSIPAVQSAPLPSPAENGKPRCAVLVVDSDPSVRQAMAAWMPRQDGFNAALTASSEHEALRLAQSNDLGLMLVSRDFSDDGGKTLTEKLSSARPDLPAYRYGVFEDSDQIFISLGGVSAGYLLRRRPPTQILEPMARPANTPALNAKQCGQQVRKYFQSFFDFSPLKGETSAAPLLTYREQEILDCLSKGYQDKEIADKLGISAWTVHSHLKNIFEKYAVHTRTEAVVKYLQK